MPPQNPFQRPWIWLVYLLLFAASIPWYFAKGSTPEIWLGLPHWVVISLLAAVAIAGFSAMLIYRLWREDQPDSMDEGDTSP